MNVKATEYQIHVAFAAWLRKHLFPGVLWWHTPNEGKRSRAESYRQHLLGLRPGVSDFCFIFDCGRSTNPYLLELKNHDNPLTEAQREFLRHARNAGASVAMVRSIEEAAKQILAWGLVSRGALAELPDPLAVSYKRKAPSIGRAKRNYAKPQGNKEQAHEC
jgi:hypothetical protein